jgi:hypothetical protein
MSLRPRAALSAPCRTSLSHNRPLAVWGRTAQGVAPGAETPGQRRMGPVEHGPGEVVVTGVLVKVQARPGGQVTRFVDGEVTDHLEAPLGCLRLQGAGLLQDGIRRAVVLTKASGVGDRKVLCHFGVEHRQNGILKRDKAAHEFPGENFHVVELHVRVKGDQHESGHEHAVLEDQRAGEYL